MKVAGIAPDHWRSSSSTNVSSLPVRKYVGKSTPCLVRKPWVAYSLPGKSTETSISFSPCGASSRATCSRSGNSSRQGVHQVAQTLTIVAPAPERLTSSSTAGAATFVGIGAVFAGTAAVAVNKRAARIGMIGEDGPTATIPQQRRFGARATTILAGGSFMRLRHLGAAALALLCTSAWARIDVTLDADALNGLIATMAPDHVDVSLAGGRT